MKKVLLSVLVLAMLFAFTIPAMTAEQEVAIPAIPTLTASSGSVTATTAVLNGTIANTGGETITERGFYYRKVSDTSAQRRVVYTSSNQFSLTITGLTPNTQYVFRAFAVNASGEGQGPRADLPGITFWTPPSKLPPPTSSELTYNSVRISWGSVPNVTGYIVRRNGIEKYYGSGTGFTDNDLQPGTTYSYTLCAGHGDGSNFSVPSDPLVVTAPRNDPYITISPYTWNPASEGGSRNFTVSTNQSFWTVDTPLPTWLRRTIDGNTLTLSADPNTSTSTRSYTVTLRAGTASCTVGVTQAGSVASNYLTVEPLFWDPPAESSTANFSVSSNQDWVITSGYPAWITATKVNNSTLRLSVTENNTGSSRFGQLVVSTQALSRTINVTQAPQVATPIVTNLTATPTIGSTSESFYFFAEANEATKIVEFCQQREGTTEIVHMGYRTGRDSSNRFDTAGFPFAPRGTYTIYAYPCDASYKRIDTPGSFKTITITVTAQAGNVEITVPNSATWPYSINTMYEYYWTPVFNADSYQCRVIVLSGNPNPNSESEPAIETLLNDTFYNVLNTNPEKASFNIPNNSSLSGNWVKLYVRAQNTDGLNGLADFRYMQIKPLTPGTPALSYANKEVTISWGKVDSAALYRIYRATSQNGLYNSIGTSRSGETSYSDGSVSAGTTYYYKVASIAKSTSLVDSRILCNGAEGDQSQANNIKIPTDTADFVITLPATNITPNSAKLNGSVPRYANEQTTYGFIYGTNPNPQPTNSAVIRGNGGVGSTGNFDINVDLTPNNTYFFRAFAHDWDSGVDIYSDVVQRFTTGDAPPYPKSVAFNPLSYTATIPVIGSPPVVVPISAKVRDQYGNVMPQFQPTYLINGYSIGVSVYSDKETVEIDTNAEEGIVIIRATFGEGSNRIVADAPLTLTKPDPINVTINLYAPSSSNTYIKIAEDAAYPFKKTFNQQMNVRLRDTVNLSTLQTVQCVLYQSDIHPRCNLPSYHKDFENMGTFSILKDYYEAVDLQNYLLGKSGNGLHTLFVDYYFYPGVSLSGNFIKEGCITQSGSPDVNKGALGLTFGNPGPPNNYSAVCSTTLKDRNGTNVLPFRTLQHEWSHSYGATIDSYDLGKGDPDKCKPPCIMNGDYMDDDTPQPSVWCERCKNIVQANRTKW